MKGLPMKNIIEIIEEMPIEEKVQNRVRVDFNIHDFKYIFEAIEESNIDDFHKKKIVDYLKNAKLIKQSYKKSMAVQKATEARSKKAKEKIQNAINILQMENNPITISSISKMGNVSYNTVKKYADEFGLM